MNEIQKECLYILKEFDRICSKYKINYFLTAGTLLGAVRHEGFIPWDDDLDVAMLREDYEKFLHIAKNELGSDFFLQTYDTEPNYYNSYLKIKSNRLDLYERPTKYVDIHKGVWIDVFPMDKVSNEPEERIVDFNVINKYDKIKRFFTQIYSKPSDRGLKKFAKTIVQYINSKLIRYYFFLDKLYAKREKEIKKYEKVETDYCNVISYPLESMDEYEKNMMQYEDCLDLTSLKFEDAFFPVPKQHHKVLSNLYGDYMKLPSIEERVGSHGIV